MDHKLHFIIGIWRSGTTLLREVLGMSNEVYIFPEHFVLLKLLSNNSKWDTKSKKDFISKVERDEDFYYFAKPNMQKLKELVQLSDNFESAIKACYAACLPEEKENITLIDKNPIYSYYLENLLEEFPNSKFIWMLREPKDNCISRVKHKIQSWQNYSYLAHWWNYTNRQIAIQAQRHPDRFLLVPYDQMVIEPQPWIEKICHFLEIQFEESMLAFETKKDSRAKEFIESVKARDGKIDENSEYAKRKVAMWENLQKPINSSKTKQWEKELSTTNINRIDAVSSAYYEALLQKDYEFNPKRSVAYESLLKLSLKRLSYKIQV